jgi:hypothetical protein
MLKVVGNFAFCAMVSEQLNLAITQLRLMRVTGTFQKLSLRAKSNRNTLDSFGKTEIGGQEIEP